MASELIGKRDTFAVEFRLESLLPSTDGKSVLPYGGVCFWVRGHSFGDLGDPTFFWTVTSARGALRRARREIDLSRLDDDRAFDEIHGREDQFDFHFYTGEGFDRFCDYVWNERGEARFVWRERTWEESGYERRPTLGGRVSFDECDRILEAFERRVEELQRGGTP
jgi:hypothetical protein